MAETLAPTAADVDRIARELRLDAAMLKESHEAFGRWSAPPTGLPAGWHGPTDIPTLAGLAGDYLWTADWLRPARLSLRFDAGHEGGQGTYTLTGLPPVVEEGVFYCVPNNPAMGWAFVSLVPQGGTARTFTVAGMLTDAAWNVGALLLNKLGEDGPMIPPFWAVRMW